MATTQINGLDVLGNSAAFDGAPSLPDFFYAANSAVAYAVSLDNGLDNLAQLTWNTQTFDSQSPKQTLSFAADDNPPASLNIAITLSLSAAGGHSYGTNGTLKSGDGSVSLTTKSLERTKETDNILPTGTGSYKYTSSFLYTNSEDAENVVKTSYSGSFTATYRWNDAVGSYTEKDSNTESSTYTGNGYNYAVRFKATTNHSDITTNNVTDVITNTVTTTLSKLAFSDANTGFSMALAGKVTQDSVNESDKWALSKSTLTNTDFTLSAAAALLIFSTENGDYDQSITLKSLIERDSDFSLFEETLTPILTEKLFDSNANLTITVNNTDGAEIHTGGGKDTITGNSGNDTLDGGDGKDKINAGAGDDTIIGSAGGDVIDGGTGIDTLDLSGESYELNYRQGVYSTSGTVNSFTIKDNETGNITTVKNVEKVIIWNSVAQEYQTVEVAAFLAPNVSTLNGVDILSGSSEYPSPNLPDFLKRTDSAVATAISNDDGLAALALEDWNDQTYNPDLAKSVITFSSTQGSTMSFTTTNASTHKLSGTIKSGDGTITLSFTDSDASVNHDNQSKGESSYTDKIGMSFTYSNKQDSGLTSDDIKGSYTETGTLSNISSDTYYSDSYISKQTASYTGNGYSFALSQSINETYTEDYSNDPAGEIADTRLVTLKQLSFSNADTGFSFKFSGKITTDFISDTAIWDNISAQVNLDDYSLSTTKAYFETSADPADALHDSLNWSINFSDLSTAVAPVVEALFDGNNVIAIKNTDGLTIHAGNGNDSVTGNNGNDTIYGDEGNDILNGGNGDDMLIGGAGQDRLTGGAGSDVFVFTSADDAGTTSSSWDIIVDFVSGEDSIDLTALDLVNGSGDLGNAFTSTAGEVIFKNGVLSMDIDGNAEADLSIKMVGVTTVSYDDLILTV